MKRIKGFSLIELMIAVVVVGILAAIAVPSYQSYVVKGNRAAAQAFMMDVENREKQYLLDARAYLSVADNASFVNLGMTVPTDVSKHYAMSISAPAATPPTFTITATPTSSQQTADGVLTLSSDGTKGPSGKW
ncbi:MAG: type IV pilin protein [Rhodocyclaceae bacterium]|nr:type IV pilin protein [Rhodocyclaceae bacterium]